jgi:hypothetical protein
MTNPDTIGGPELSAQDAIQQIQFVMQRVALMGRNDSELNDIQRIITNLEAGDISPADAVAAAEKIEQDKQQH